MSAGTQTFPKAFAVWFKDLHLWSVGSFMRADWQWPASDVRPLSSVLKRKLITADKSQAEKLQLATLRFDGTIEPRGGSGGKGFKGKLFVAEVGDVIYSKIDVRNGAIGIVPEGLGRVAVSSEFPVYEVLPEVAEPEYVKLVFRTERFRRVINGMISGASGRKRVQPSQLEDMEVPLPPLPLQRAIVARWRRAKDEHEATSERVERLRIEIDAQFFADLGLHYAPRAARPKAFAVLWKDMLRWGVNYNQLAQSGEDITRGAYPVCELGSILELVQYGTSEKANRAGEGTPVIRMNNIVDGLLDLTNLKHITLPKQEKEKLLLQDGDILFNRTNSKELVGKCAAFRVTSDYVFASYLIRLRVDTEKALPEYVVYAVNSPIGRRQIDALSRQIIGQANVNTEELRSLQIPLPSLEVQSEIVRRVEEGRAEIAREREAAERRARAAAAEVEALILGAKKISD